MTTVVDASTDSVRFGLTDSGGWSFSNWFTVRPDERVEDAAPHVTLHSPQGGSFGGGATVAISWAASDDEGIRSVSIQASYDGGLIFHDVAGRLPGGLSSFNWKLPPLAQAIPDVRIRVIVEDLRFQNSSATSGPIALNPGNGSPTADLNGDGFVDGFDLALLLGAWGQCPVIQPCAADLNGDGTVGGIDLGMLLGVWTGSG